MPELAQFLPALVAGLLLGLALGSGCVYLLLKQQLKQALAASHALQAQLDQQTQAHDSIQAQHSQLDREHAITCERLQHIQSQHDKLDQQYAHNQQQLLDSQQTLADQQAQLASLHSKLDEDHKHHAEKQTFYKESIAQLNQQFKATASELLVATGEKISAQHNEKFSTLMQPLRENLGRFEKEFKAAYSQEAREQISLKEHIKHLGELNNKLSDEAHALANALKGDSKLRGNWGEHILEHILQSSGLREGHEYSTQASFNNQEGGRLQPDVLINLPDNKSIIVDSKVTLNSWMDFVSAENEEQRQLALKSFVAAVQLHIKSLSEKAYHKIDGIKTLDFVLLFIPIETAFLYALQDDSNIYDSAHQRNIILVSPTTLMAVLKTIAVNWKYDRQEKNALLIAKEGERLLDKIHNYMDDLSKARNSIGAANKHMERAYKRFATGKGNILGSVDKLKQLGIKSAKKIGVEWEAIEEDYEGEEDTSDDADLDEELSENVGASDSASEQQG